LARQRRGHKVFDVAPHRLGLPLRNLTKPDRLAASVARHKENPPTTAGIVSYARHTSPRFHLSPYGARQIGLPAASNRFSPGPRSFTTSMARGLPFSSNRLRSGPNAVMPRLAQIEPFSSNRINP